MDAQKKIVPQYINAKAGMDSVNAESIAKKVAELTVGTPKDLHEKQLQRKRALEVASMLQKITKFKMEDRQEMKKKWHNKISEMESARPLDRFWTHLDFDMFYVACELLDKPEFREKPCAVGGESSVLCTANYPARLFGVRAAMPTFIAKKLCPQLILFSPNFEKYRKFADIFREILRKFDPNLESHGLDEAYIDMTEHMKSKNIQQQQKILQNIRNQILARTGLTVSCGMGANKLLAKMCSEQNKPNGQFILQNQREAILNFMFQRKIRKIHGIGPVNQYFLNGIGIKTARDVLENTDSLAICFSENSCQYFISTAMGLGSIEHEFKQRQSIGKSQTFRPTSDKQFLQSKLSQLCDQVSLELEELGFVSINVILSYITQNYERKDKTINLDKYTTKKEDLFQATFEYLKDHIILLSKKVRLLGVKCSSLMKINEWKRKSLISYFAKIKDRDFEKKKNGQSSQKSSLKSEPTTKPTSVSKQSEMLSEIKQKSQFICPICNKQIACMNNLSAFNRHIDKCLKGK